MCIYINSLVRSILILRCIICVSDHLIFKISILRALIIQSVQVAPIRFPSYGFSRYGCDAENIICFLFHCCIVNLNVARSFI